MQRGIQAGFSSWRDLRKYKIRDGILEFHVSREDKKRMKSEDIHLES